MTIGTAYTNLDTIQDLCQVTIDTAYTNLDTIQDLCQGDNRYSFTNLEIIQIPYQRKVQIDLYRLLSLAI